MERKQLSFRDGIINYTDCGTGNTLVLLHGFLGSLSVWDELVSNLSKQFRIICIDLPGHGNTSAFGNVHTMEFMSDCVYEVLEHESVSQYVIIGHSMGGYTALTFAEKYPEKLIGFGLFHSHASSDSDQKKKDRTQIMHLVKQNPERVVREMLPKLFAKEDVSSYPDTFKNLSEIANSMSAEAIIAALAGMRDRKDMQHVLRDTKIPVLYILGKQDALILYEETKQQQTLSEYIVPVVLENSGHMGFIEEFSKSLNAVSEFTKCCFELK